MSKRNRKRKERTPTREVSNTIDVTLFRIDVPDSDILVEEVIRTIASHGAGRINGEDVPVIDISSIYMTHASRGGGSERIRAYSPGTMRDVDLSLIAVVEYVRDPANALYATSGAMRAASMPQDYDALPVDQAIHPFELEVTVPRDTQLGKLALRY